MSYHLKKIPKGILGEFSKITEEYLEALDSQNQTATVMTILELSDLYGAINAFIEKYGLTMKDLEKMSELTARAFKDGTRK